MLNLSFEQIFGRRSYQDSRYLTICKLDLPNLNPEINNRAEQLLIALILQIHQQFEGELTDPNGEAVIDAQGKVITYSNVQLYEKVIMRFWKQQSYKTRGRYYDLIVLLLEFFAKPSFDVPVKLNPNSLDY